MTKYSIAYAILPFILCPQLLQVTVFRQLFASALAYWAIMSTLANRNSLNQQDF